MEKEKILAWLDKLVELSEEIRASKFYDPEAEYGGLVACTNYTKEIQLHRSVGAICAICGFKMKVFAANPKVIGFTYKGYRFCELVLD